MVKKPIDYTDRTEHGDPTPKREGNVLTPDELAGKPTPEPVRTGTVQHTKRCSVCGLAVSVHDVTCQVCAPGAKPTFGGRNMNDPTAAPQPAGQYGRRADRA
jgi:hypothetical protein